MATVAATLAAPRGTPGFIAAAHHAAQSNTDGWLVLAGLGVLLVMWIASKRRR